MKTLIIDDTCAPLAVTFEKWGLCDVATTGMEGLSYIINSYKIKCLYSLIILDIVLPELSGFDIIKQIRSLEVQYNIKPIEEAKIVVVTSRTDEPSILEAFRNGATGWINKPIEVNKLIKVVQEFTRNNL